MSINPGFELPFGIQPTNPVPVDAWSGPFTAASFVAGVSAANLAIPNAVRFQSMEVRLIVGGESYKYWYGGGTGDGDLVSFQGAAGSTAEVTSINGCTGILGITGTIGEIEVTNACPNIIVGLPNNITIFGNLSVGGDIQMVGSIYIDGGTY